MFELIIGLWMVQNAAGETMVCDKVPDLTKFVNRWQNPQVAEMPASARLEDNYKYHIVDGQCVEKPAPVDNSVYGGLPSKFLAVLAEDATVSDAVMAIARRLVEVEEGKRKAAFIALTGSLTNAEKNKLRAAAVAARMGLE